MRSLEKPGCIFSPAAQFLLFATLPFFFLLSSASAEPLVKLSDPVPLDYDGAISGNGNRFVAGILSNQDVSGDGYDDLLVVIGNNPDTNPFKRNSARPVLLIYSPAIGKFVLEKSFASVSPRMSLPRQAYVGDLDGNGMKDIFIGGTGIDTMEFGCGEHNQLLMQTEYGFVDYSASLPNVLDFSHGLVPIDVDQDGTMELLVLNQDIGPDKRCASEVKPKGESYLLDFDEKGAKEVELQTKSSNLNIRRADGWQAVVGDAADVNLDGYDDLLLAADGEFRALVTNGSAVLRREISFAPPSSFEVLNSKGDCWRPDWMGGECFIAHSFVATEDFDHDGQLEVLVSFYGRTNSGKGMHQLQMLKRTTVNEWQDITGDLVPVQNDPRDTDGWCFKLWFRDFNGDGNKDILCSPQRTYEVSADQGFLYLWKEGRYKMAPISQLKVLGARAVADVFIGQGLDFITPVDLGSRSLLVGVSYEGDEYGPKSISILGAELP